MLCLCLASGSLFGLIGAQWARVFLHRHNLLAKKVRVWPLARETLFNLCLGFMPWIDNFMHIGGAFAGLLLGLALFVRPKAARGQVITDAQRAVSNGVLAAAESAASQRSHRGLRGRACRGVRAAPARRRSRLRAGHAGLISCIVFLLSAPPRQS